MADKDPNSFFTNRDAIVGIAIAECVSKLLSPHADGNYLGSWIMTEISLWDNDKERLVLMSTKTLTMVKYDFITLKLLEYRKILLEQIDTLIYGDLIYPAGSLAPARNSNGVRLMWNRGVDVSFLKKWNPFSKDFPYVTYTSHPLVWHKDVVSKHTFDIEDFTRIIVLAVDNAQDMSISHNRVRCQMEKKPIILQNYFGLGSIIHNRSGLGFFKVRGKFSF